MASAAARRRTGPALAARRARRRMAGGGGHALGPRLRQDAAPAWLAGSTPHSDPDPTSPGGGSFALVLKLLGHAHGWPFPRGGAQALAEALVRRIEAGGGSVRHDAAVAEIL